MREALAPAVNARQRVHALRRSPDRYVGEAALARLAARARPRAAATLLSRPEPRPSASRAARFCSGSFRGRIRDGRRPSKPALVARGVLVIAGDEARVPGTSDLAGPERELSQRIVDALPGARPESSVAAEAAEAVRHRPKVVEGLIALPGQARGARPAARRLVHRPRRDRRRRPRACADRASHRSTSASSRRCSA